MKTHYWTARALTSQNSPKTPPKTHPSLRISVAKFCYFSAKFQRCSLLWIRCIPDQNRNLSRFWNTRLTRLARISTDPEWKLGRSERLKRPQTQQINPLLSCSVSFSEFQAGFQSSIRILEVSTFASGTVIMQSVCDPQLTSWRSPLTQHSRSDSRQQIRLHFQNSKNWNSGIQFSAVKLHHSTTLELDPSNFSFQRPIVFYVVFLKMFEDGIWWGRSTVLRPHCQSRG